MVRKVIKQGNNTLTITLPRTWSSKFNIQGGDELGVEEKGKSLILTSKKEGSSESVEINIDSSEKFLKRSITSLYRQGVDEIKVNFKDNKVLTLLQKETSSLLGFEIVEQGKNYCIIKNVAVAMESEFSTIIKRIFLMLKTNFAEIIIAIKDKDYTELENIKENEKINNKLVNFCQRTINKKGQLENYNITSTFSMVSQLERVADDLRDICQILSDNKTQIISKETLDLINSCGNIFNKMYNYYYKFSAEQLVEMTREESETIKKCKELIQKKKGFETLIIYHVMSIIKQLHHITDVM
jgi:phosphate uptake regulator